MAISGSLDSWWHDLNKVIILGYFDSRIHPLRDNGIIDFASEQAGPESSLHDGRPAQSMESTGHLQYLVLDRLTSENILETRLIFHINSRVATRAFLSSSHIDQIRIEILEIGHHAFQPHP